MAHIEILSPIEDLIFKAIFGKKQNLDILENFLKSVIDIPAEEYDYLELSDTNLRVNHKNDKFGILDIKLYTKNGKIIDIEIQTSPIFEMRQRILYYSTKMVWEQLSLGNSYNNIKQAISIVILDFNLINENNEYHNSFVLYDKRTDTVFTNMLEIHTLELKKVPDIYDNSELFYWLKFLKSKSEEELKMISKKNPAIEKAYEELLALSQDKTTRAEYEARLKTKRDEISRLEGMYALGEAKGKAEEKIFIAKNLLLINIPISQIAIVTGLSEDDIERLR